MQQSTAALLLLAFFYLQMHVFLFTATNFFLISFSGRHQLMNDVSTVSLKYSEVSINKNCMPQCVIAFFFIKYRQLLIIFTNPSARAGYDTRSIFKWSLTGLNSELSFSKTCCLTKAEESSLPCYLPIAGGRIFGFIPFPGVLVLCEMQSVQDLNLCRRVHILRR